jgi:hypothetical protein
MILSYSTAGVEVLKVLDSGSVLKTYGTRALIE